MSLTTTILDFAAGVINAFSPTDTPLTGGDLKTALLLWGDKTLIEILQFFGVTYAAFDDDVF